VPAALADAPPDLPAPAAAAAEPAAEPAAAAAEPAAAAAADEAVAAGQQMTEHTPAERTRMYRELAAQKEVCGAARSGRPDAGAGAGAGAARRAEAAADERGPAAAGRADPRRVPSRALSAVRPGLTAGRHVLQRNEGKWEFRWDDSPDGACLLLDVAVGCARRRAPGRS
jgi:hypothetical protein